MAKHGVTLMGSRLEGDEIDRLSISIAEVSGEAGRMPMLKGVGNNQAGGAAFEKVWLSYRQNERIFSCSSKLMLCFIATWEGKEHAYGEKQVSSRICLSPKKMLPCRNLNYHAQTGVIQLKHSMC